MPHIKKLHLHGFKSFAKPTDLIFDKGLNTIVGANGSGKSNLADAICFVLGRLRVRSLRATRAAKLIYHGGKTGKPSQKAIVSMVFDNSDSVFSLSEKEVEISRIVKKDGTSTYKINGQTKTRQEVLELLAQAGIDPEGFNIILQAEISKVVQMHPEEKREIIEDIAGISIYEIRKVKSFRELEKTESKLKEVRTILNEKTAYMRNLEKEKAQAERYKQLKRRIRQDKAALIFKQVHEKKENVKRLDKKISDKKEQIEKTKDKADLIQNKIVDFNRQIRDIDKHIEKKSGIEQEDLFNQLSELRSGAAVLNVKLENYEQQSHAIRKRIEQLEIDKVRLGQELKELERERSRKTKKELKLSADDFKIEILSAAAKLREQTKKLGEIFSDLFSQIKERKTRIDDLIRQNKIKNVHEEVNALIYVLEQNVPELDRLSEGASSLAESISKLEISEDEKGGNINVEIELAKKELDRIYEIIKKSHEEKKDFEKLLEELKKEQSGKKDKIFSQEKLEKKLRKSFEQLLLKKSQLQGTVKKQELLFKEAESRDREIENELNTLAIMKARVDAELEVIMTETDQYSDLKEELEKVRESAAELENRMRKDERTLEEIGSVNLRALEVYDRLKAEYDETALRLQKLEEEKNEILKIIAAVDRKKKQAFMQAFNAINISFNENFLMLSNKGQAFLELENKQDPFKGGLDIVIKLAKGKYMDADSLSGGEKVIIALSLIFAIQRYKPYCFYIFDEIDPALDKRNSERLASLLRKNVQKSQCIIITHNDAIINQANTLYGATMQDGVSKIISLKV